MCHQPKFKCHPTIASLISNPDNKKQYTPNEVIKIVSLLPGNTKTKEKVMKDIVSVPESCVCVCGGGLSTPSSIDLPYYNHSNRLIIPTTLVSKN